MPCKLGSSGPARFQATPPACYRASWQLPGPDFHRQAMTSLRWAPQACILAAAERPVRVAEVDELFATGLRGLQRLAPGQLWWRLDPDPPS